MLKAEDILGIVDVHLEPHEVPEWETTIHLRVMSGKQRDDVVSAAERAMKKGGDLDARSKLLRMCICDETGAPLFSLAQIPALMEKNGVVLDRIAKAAMELNGLMPDAAELAEGN